MKKYINITKCPKVAVRIPFTNRKQNDFLSYLQTPWRDFGTAVLMVFLVYQVQKIWVI